jgi:RNA polymerase sigma factor (sigma-70 family)
MTTSGMREAFQHLRRTVLMREGRGLTDAQLVEDFVKHRDEAAVAALVARHGPMVWGVCRRMLHNHQDAEDAFQATFLVLVRRADSIAPRGLVGNWLYGVAHRTALKARALAVRRRARERQVNQMPEPAVPENEFWRDVEPWLDQELSALPDKYRAVIVLCELEGKTRKEAAKQLGVPEGTISGRLARARQLLARRLARQGLAVTAGTLGAALAPGAATAVPPLVVSSTIKAATSVAAGEAAAASIISARVAALTQGVLKTMLWTKIKVTVTALLLVALAAGGTSALLQRVTAQDQKPMPQGQTRLALPVQSTAPPQRTASRDLASLWADLASDQEIRAARAILALAATPRETTALFKGHLRAVKVDPERVDRWVADLGSSDFKKRDAAFRELEYLGKYVKRHLDKHLAKAPSEEVRQRLLKLLEPLDPKAVALPLALAQLRGTSVSASSTNGVIEILIDGKPLDLKALTQPPAAAKSNLAWLRAARAAVVLEQIATPEARQLLRMLADGEPEAPPTAAAKEALERMNEGR